MNGTCFILSKITNSNMSFEKLSYLTNIGIFKLIFKISHVDALTLGEFMALSKALHFSSKEVDQFFSYTFCCKLQQKV